MRHFVVEVYLSRVPREGFHASVARARRAAVELSGEGLAVRHLRSAYAADDETCFHFFDASSADIVAEASSRAGLDHDRIAELQVSDAPEPSLQMEGDTEGPRPRGHGERRDVGSG
jgi:hypothetical protein